MNNTKIKEVHELNIGDKVSVQLGNPNNIDFKASEELEVIRIEKAKVGWRFLGEGVGCLYDCMFNPYEDKALAPYLSLNARTIGRVGGETKAEAIASLRYSPD